jgi:gamma-glutamylputrescine oxidase
MKAESIAFNSDNIWGRCESNFVTEVLDFDLDCDHLIIGAGFSGLSIAFHLLKHFGPKKRVVVIDSEGLGEGASGRNSGMLGPGIGGQYHRLESRYGKAMAKQMFQSSLDALAYSIDLIRSENFECDLVLGSQFKVSTNTSNEHQLRQEANALLCAGFDICTFSEQDLVSIVNGNRYMFALEYAKTATIHPQKLLNSLAEKVRSMGGEIYLQTPCLALGDTSASTPNATIRFNRAVVATNGFSANLSIQKSRVIPVSTSLMLTAPLDVHQRNRLGLSAQNAIIDSRRIFNYFRLTPDNRLLFGGGAPFYSSAGIIARQRSGKLEPEKTYKELLNALHRYLPQLFPVNIEKVWSGTIGVTLDNLPVVCSGIGNIDRAIGWCGHGLALSLANGRDYVAQLTGLTARPHWPWYRSDAPYLAPTAVLPWASNSYICFLGWMDRINGD